MNKKIQLLVAEEDDGIRLDRWFKRHYPHIQHGHLQKLLRKKDIRVNGKKAEASQRLEQGQEINVPNNLSEIDKSKVKAPKTITYDQGQIDEFKKTILYEDEDILIINKPHGLAVQGGSKIEVSVDSICQQIWQKEGVRPKLVHRLDKDTSGILILAKAAKMAANLADAFKNKKANKTYIALVKNVPSKKEGLIDLPLNKEKYGGNEKMVINHEEGKKSQTTYKVIESVGKEMALVELNPITGRTHQLRVHMAAINCPIVGDRKYGGKEAVVDGISQKLHLHAYKLSLPFIKKNFKAPLPEHIAKTLKYIGVDVP